MNRANFLKVKSKFPIEIIYYIKRKNCNKQIIRDSSFD